VLPVLTARVHLATDLNGSVPAGKSTVTVSAGRIQHARASALKSVKLRVRFAGKNWTTIKLTATGTGRYTGTLDSTGFAGQSADLLLQATDKGGSSFEQTTLRAYSVADQ
jgi:maltose-binding protein MalE